MLHTVPMLIRRVVALLRLLRGYIILTNTVLDERGDLSLRNVRNGGQRERPHMIMVVSVEHARDTDRTRTIILTFGTR